VSQALREAVPTPQQISDYLQGLDATERAVIEREARALRPGQESVAEIFAAFRADGSLAGTAFTAESAGYWSGCRVVRYTAPPAQGIDLEQFRPVVLDRRMDAVADGKHEAVHECDRLLALIDRQRDAAPGVGNG